VDQREIVKKLEEHFREEEKSQHEYRKRIHEDRLSLTDQEWWEELINRTKSIRPQMLSIFERNKEEMISKRFQTIHSEVGFREKLIQQKVIELLPHVSAIRVEIGVTGDLTVEHIQLAALRFEAQSREKERNNSSAKPTDIGTQEDTEVEVDFIQNLIDIQIRRQEELN
jgi:hypothetical protein